MTASVSVQATSEWTWGMFIEGKYSSPGTSVRMNLSVCSCLNRSVIADLVDARTRCSGDGDGDAFLGTPADVKKHAIQ